MINPRAIGAYIIISLIVQSEVISRDEESISIFF
jgi:hypothetical protein